MITIYRVSLFYWVLLISVIASLAIANIEFAATRAYTSIQVHRSTAPIHNNVKQHVKPLRYADYSEERAIEISGIARLKDQIKSGAQNLKMLAERAKRKFTSNNQLATDKSFARLNVGNVKSKLLESKEFQKWVNSVTKAYKKYPKTGDVAVVSSLISHYDDYSVAALLATARGVSSTKDMAIRLEDALFTNWIVKEKSVDDVFKVLKLNMESDKLIQNRVWNTWVSYLKRLDDQDSESVIFAILSKYYDDEHLAKILSAAMQDSRSKTLASKLDAMQRESWLKNGMAADEVFKILKLNQEIDGLLNAPMLATWVSYVKLRNEDPYEFLLLKLSKYYDDGALANILHSARNNPRTYAIADDVADAQLKNWLKRSKTTDDVFNLLKFDVEGGQFLQSPLLYMWMAYVTKLRADPYQLILSKLANHYDIEGLVKAVIAAKKKHITIGMKLEELLFQSWMKKHQSADDLFILLQLNKDPDQLFDSPVFLVWTSYVLKLKGVDSDEQMFLVLKKYYDDSLKGMINAANSRGNGLDVASKVQEEMWRSEGKSIDDIFNLLKLKEQGRDAFDAREFITWVSYANKLNADQGMVLSTLRSGFGDTEMARMLARSKLKASKNDAVDALNVINDVQALQLSQFLAVFTLNASSV